MANNVLACKIRGRYSESNSIQGTFYNTIKINGVFKDENPSVKDSELVKLNGVYEDSFLVNGIFSAIKLNGLSNSSKDIRGIFLGDIDLRGFFVDTSSYLIGDFKDSLKLAGILNTAISLNGLFTCVPSSKACTSYTLDFHYSCNSSHIYTCGF
jgi:hypothetical protein